MRNCPALKRAGPCGRTDRTAFDGNSWRADRSRLPERFRHCGAEDASQSCWIWLWPEAEVAAGVSALYNQM